ncbi:MAG: hypothetical protein H8F28_02100 [Fibrella sp.]|nr:hypothetical protein [Armatimonadota bacterium]
MSKFSDDLAPIGGLQPLGGNVATQPNTEPTVSNGTPEPVGPTASPTLPPGIGYGPSSPALINAPRGPISHRPSYDDPEQASKIPLYVTGGVGLAALIGIVILLIPAPPVPPPTAWEPFTAADESFTCELPKEWNIHAMGKASTDSQPSIGDGVTAKKGNASIEMTVSSVTGLLTGQLLFGDDPIPSGVFNSRAAPIHRAHGKQFKNRFRGFKETKVTPTPQMFPKMTGVVMDKTGKEFVPDIRWNEYTAGGNQFGFGGKRHGYRVTVGGGMSIVNVICESSERDWEKMKPAFERTIVSVNEMRKMPATAVPMPGGGSMPMGGEVPGFGGSGLGGGQ